MSHTAHNETEVQISRRTPVVELPEFLTVAEFATYMNVGRTAAYEFARVHGVRIGRIVRVPREKLAAR